MIIACTTCGENFEFAEGEQKFFDTMGFTYPKRCKSCRQKKKQQFDVGNAKPVKNWKDKRKQYGDE